MPEDQDSFQCSIIEIQMMSKLSPKSQQRKVPVFSFPQGKKFMIAKLRSGDQGRSCDL
jgi:hypothetical protein